MKVHGAFRGGTLRDENSRFSLLERYVLKGGIGKWIS